MDFFVLSCSMEEKFTRKAAPNDITPELTPHRFFSSVKALRNDSLLKICILFPVEYQSVSYVWSSLENCKLIKGRSKAFILVPLIIQCSFITSICALFPTPSLFSLVSLISISWRFHVFIYMEINLSYLGFSNSASLPLTLKYNKGWLTK